MCSSPLIVLEGFHKLVGHMSGRSHATKVFSGLEVHAKNHVQRFCSCLLTESSTTGGSSAYVHHVRREEKPEGMFCFHKLKMNSSMLHGFARERSMFFYSQKEGCHVLGKRPLSNPMPSMSSPSPPTCLLLSLFYSSRIEKREREVA